LVVEAAVVQTGGASVWALVLTLQQRTKGLCTGRKRGCEQALTCTILQAVCRAGS